VTTVQGLQELKEELQKLKKEVTRRKTLRDAAIKAGDFSGVSLNLAACVGFVEDWLVRNVPDQAKPDDKPNPDGAASAHPNPGSAAGEEPGPNTNFNLSDDLRRRLASLARLSGDILDLVNDGRFGLTNDKDADRDLIEGLRAVHSTSGALTASVENQHPSTLPGPATDCVNLVYSLIAIANEVLRFDTELERAGLGGFVAKVEDVVLDAGYIVRQSM